MTNDQTRCPGHECPTYAALTRLIESKERELAEYRDQRDRHARLAHGVWRP